MNNCFLLKMQESKIGEMIEEGGLCLVLNKQQVGLIDARLSRINTGLCDTPTVLSITDAKKDAEEELILSDSDIRKINISLAKLDFPGSLITVRSILRYQLCGGQ